MTAYHVTEKKNLKSILANGLKPSIGPRSKDLGEAKEAVYFFTSLDDVANALMNWLGEWYEDQDDVELVILEVDLSAIKVEHEAFEVQVYESIDPSRIIQVIDEEDLEHHLD